PDRGGYPKHFSLAAGAFLPSSFAFQVPVLLSSKRRFLLKSKTITRVLTKFMLRLRLAFTKCSHYTTLRRIVNRFPFLNFSKRFSLHPVPVSAPFPFYSAPAVPGRT